MSFPRKRESRIRLLDPCLAGRQAGSRLGMTDTPMSLFSKFKKVEKLSPQLRNLYLHQVIKNIGLEVIGIFGAIFLYQITGSLAAVLWIFLIVSFFYFLLLPLWAKLLRLINLHILMSIGTVLLLVNVIIFYFLSPGVSSWPQIFLLGFLILAEVAHRLFYWVPYHVDLARFIDTHHRGRQLSALAILVSVIGIALPAFSAFIIVRFGFPVLFILASCLILMSVFPIFFIRSGREFFSFRYAETFTKLFDRKHFKSNLAYFANGFQNAVSQIVWPIFIFLILEGRYLKVGLLSATIILVVCILRYAVGEATDRLDKKKLIRAGSILYAIGWLFKAVASATASIFLAGVYHDFTSVIVYTPFDALMYEIAADQGHYVDEFTILREMSLHVGRVVALALGLLIVYNFGINYVFIAAAAVSLLLSLVSKEEFISIR